MTKLKLPIVLICLMCLDLMIFKATAQNVETRSFLTIKPNKDDTNIYHFGTSMAVREESKSSFTLYAGAPSFTSSARRNGTVYACSFNPVRDAGTTVVCSPTINFGNTQKIGISMDVYGTGSGFIVCDSEYKLLCPNASAFLVGSCYKYDSLTSTKSSLTTPCTSFCPTALIADIIFLLDESGSVKSDEFSKALNWINRVLESFRFDIDQGALRVGVITFANSPTLHIRLSQSSYSTLSSRVTNIPKRRGGTNIGDAINAGVAEFEARGRPKVPRQIILLTDGYPSDSETYGAVAENARNLGIITVSVGVGSSVGDYALLNIAGDKSRIFKATDFSNLESVVSGLRQVITESATVNLEGKNSNSSNLLTQCQLGLSAYTSKNNNLYVGAVGSYDRAGSVVNYNSINIGVDNEFSGILNGTKLENMMLENISYSKDDYLGYSVTSGYFFGKAEEYVASGQPRFQSKGAILIYKPGSQSLSNVYSVHPSASGGLWQLGAYFGHSVCSIDLNNDLYDDLLVSSPLYSNINGYDQGRVFVFLNKPAAPGPTSWMSSMYKPQILVGSNMNGGRFGMTIVNGGDIDRNGFEDVIIGAPLEEASSSGSGAVYIYYVSGRGITDTWKQRIIGKTLSSPLHNFGMTVIGGHNKLVDLDGNKYPDVFVAAPSSDTVIVMRSRPVVDVTSNISLIPPSIDIIGCLSRPNQTCTTVKICISAESRVKEDTSNNAAFDMRMALTLDSLITNAASKRFFFVGEGSPSSINLPQSVTATATCISHSVRLNGIAFDSTVGADFLSTIPRVVLSYDLTPVTKEKLYSTVLDPTRPNNVSSDWYFLTGCQGPCDHDLQIMATFSLPVASQPHVIDQTTVIFSVKLLLQNNGPDHSYSTKINITSGVLTISKITGNCVTHALAESSPGLTILYFKSSSPFLKSLMESGVSCEINLDYSLQSLVKFANSSFIQVQGAIYSNAGGVNVSFDPNENNNRFTYKRQVLYSSKYQMGKSFTPNSIFYNRSLEPAFATSLLDPVLGGNKTNIQHIHTMYNLGPHLLSKASMSFTWPAALTPSQKSPLLYLYDFSCTPSSVCKCHINGKVNRFKLGLNNISNVKVSLNFPSPNSVNLPALTNCTSAFCDVIMCEVTNLPPYNFVNLTSSFKLWLPTLSQNMLVTTMSSYLRLDISQSPVFPQNIAYSSTATIQVSAYIPPPSNQGQSGMDIGAIIGGIVGGVALLALVALISWKAGFFESKYATMKKEAMQEADGRENEGEVTQNEAKSNDAFEE